MNLILLSIRGFVNLEPWYEGILDRFREPDQLYAYWVSMLAGAVSHCYGAHGVWNAGDGSYLDHWGSQTLEQAMALDTPRLMGLSHQVFRPYIDRPAMVNVDEKGNGVASITRSYEDLEITFIPEVSQADIPPAGKYGCQWKAGSRINCHLPARWFYFLPD